MTLEQFNQIKQAGIDKWEPALELKTLEDKKHWWLTEGKKKCSFCKYYYHTIRCLDGTYKETRCSTKDEKCPLKNSRDCMREFDYIIEGSAFGNIADFESAFDTNVPLILARIKALTPEDCGVNNG